MLIRRAVVISAEEWVQLNACYELCGPPIVISLETGLYVFSFPNLCPLILLIPHIVLRLYGIIVTSCRTVPAACRDCIEALRFIYVNVRASIRIKA
jgi:hypothetical protein